MEWVEVADLATVERRKRMLVEVGDHKIALFHHEGRVHALDNTCIHRQRELVKGTVFKGRVVCPGHQWAFDLETGFEEKMCRFQPTYAVRVDEGRVFVNPEPNPVPETGAERARAAEGGA